MNIEILISTIDDGLFKIAANNEYDYLIVHQITNNYKADEYRAYFENRIKSKKIKYIQSNLIGLSKSRNIALDNASGDILWIMDDDVKILNGLTSVINKKMKENHDILILNHQYSNEINIIEKKMKEYNHNIISSAKICSIDICMKKEVTEKLRFDENFGLGTDYPSGEEFIFISNAIKNGYSVHQTDIIASIHPPISSGLDFFSTKNKTLAKRKMFDQVFNKFGILFTTLFFIKKINLLYRNKKIWFFIKNAILNNK
ncbi:glycosyltransferase family A protein [Xenorhabdus bovienii]|uniref:glycosyltransferase family A protein n=1 Tax=Xenorhabdus bovienii TaxID=40576 RepID=UPI0021572146|nr:glycosyltransferase family A protein [Xenorhabdus bovienii]